MREIRPSVLALSLAGLLLTAGLPVRADIDPGEVDGEAARAYRQGYNLILDENWQDALKAFEALTRSHPQSAWADDAAFWRCYAGEQLGRGDAEHFACYEALLASHPDSEWQDEARRAMVRLAQKLDRGGQPHYREKVRDFGQDDDSDRLLAILVALGEIGDERSVEVILERLDAAEDEQTRARIVGVLEDIESERVLEKLHQLLEGDPSEQVRLSALEALADHDTFNATDLLRRLVKDASQPLRLRLEALDELEDEAPADLLAILRDLALGDNRAMAMEAIDEIGDVEGTESVTVLAEILAKSGDFERRAEVLDTLEDLELDAAVKALLDVARRDPDPRMRRLATDSLGDMETEAAREALIELLRETEN